MGKLLACRTNEIQRKKTNVTTPLLLNLLGDQNPDRAVWVTSTFLRPGLLPGPPHWPVPAPLLRRLTGALFTTPSERW